MEKDELIRKIRDEHDYSYIYGELYDYVRGYARKEGLYDDEAYDDIFQNSVLGLFMLINKEDFKLACKFTVLFIGIFKKQMYKYFNKQMPLISNEHDIPYEEDFDSNIPIISEIILSGINNLSDGQKEIMKLMYFEGKSQNEIADELGYSNAKSIKTQKYKALKKISPFIKAKLIEYDIEDYTLEF
ncbi:MAG: RNA polymerase sigma factor [Promethearchaeota archaeon]|jgi:RNA polymerase sigma factor (sigma-70 family)